MSEYVPDHRQFAELTYDVHAFTQREKQLKRAGLCDNKEQRFGVRLGAATVAGLVLLYGNSAASTDYHAGGQTKDDPNSPEGNGVLTPLSRLSCNLRSTISMSTVY